MPPSPGTHNQCRCAKEIPRELLPDNFEKLSWEKQTSFCIKAIISWATQQGKSAAILVLVPGDKEMQLVIAQWLSVPSQATLKHVVFRVNSQTPKCERKRIRDHLAAQGCYRNNPHSIVVATKVFESSITLPINGLINTGMAMDLDCNGHLKLYLCTNAQTVQGEGRAGRMFDSLFKSLRPSDVDPPPSQDYEIPKNDALPLILGAVCLKKSFPIIGITETAQIQY